MAITPRILPFRPAHRSLAELRRASAMGAKALIHCGLDDNVDSRCFKPDVDESLPLHLTPALAVGPGHAYSTLGSPLISSDYVELVEKR